MPRVLTTNELRKLGAVYENGNRVLFAPKQKPAEVPDEPDGSIDLSKISESLSKIADAISQSSSTEAIQKLSSDMCAVRDSLDSLRNKSHVAYSVAITKRGKDGAIVACQLSPVK